MAGKLQARRIRLTAMVGAVLVALTSAGCSSFPQAAQPISKPSAQTASESPSAASPSSQKPAQQPPAKKRFTHKEPRAGASSPDGGRKVLLIVEENVEYAGVIGSPAAPVINKLARRYGLATNYQAGYPKHCPSLAAYLILTSGSTHDICDDRGPRHHQLSGDNLFAQVVAAGLEYRQYSESMPANCAWHDSADLRYLVRHAPVPYYLTESARCGRWDVPAGTPSAGPLHDALTTGTLAAFTALTPDACHDMHGGPACPTDTADLIAAGDTWAGAWLKAIMAGPDYTSGRLTVILTWDEGSGDSNQVATVVISPTTGRMASDAAFTHCSTLRTFEELLGLQPLGCATSAQSLVKEFRLG